MLFEVGNTAQELPQYTRAALRDLRAGAIQDRFGMFFLQSLDLKMVR